jgi:signal transduction histidine kinase
LGFEPRVLFDGPVDTVVPPSLADEMVAVLRESLSNVSRHACAQSVTVEVAVDSSKLTLVTTDDGVGMDAAPSDGGRGIGNMRARAGALGGTFALQSSPGRGTRVCWSVPLAAG